MNIASISLLLRRIVLRTASRALMHLAGFVFRRVVAPGLRPAPAAARAGRGSRARAQAANNRVLDGEFHRVDARRVDPRHNDRW